MPKSGLFLGLVPACVAASAFQAPAVALPQEPAADVGAASADRGPATNKDLLDALRQRRAELARTMPDDEHRRYMFDFLDRQIESVRRDLGD